MTADPIKPCRQWINCPICGEPDMRCDKEDDGFLVTCVNTGCPSNIPMAELDIPMFLRLRTPAPAPQEAILPGNCDEIYIRSGVKTPDEFHKELASLFVANGGHFGGVNEAIRKRDGLLRAALSSQAPAATAQEPFLCCKEYDFDVTGVNRNVSSREIKSLTIHNRENGKQEVLISRTEAPAAMREGDIEKVRTGLRYIMDLGTYHIPTGWHKVDQMVEWLVSSGLLRVGEG